MSPLAYQKVVTAIDFNSWEVGFYGITDDDDVTRIHDVFMPEQECNDARNEFDDASVNEYVASYLKRKYSHRQLTTVWIHTHPGSGKPIPSLDDRDMHKSMLEYGGDIAIMIIATKTHIKAWLKANTPKGLDRVVESEEDVEVDWTMNTIGKFRLDKWKKRHAQVVTHLAPPAVVVHSGSASQRKCPRCFQWKPALQYRSCSNVSCSVSLLDYCQVCREATGMRCMLCCTNEQLVREAQARRNSGGIYNPHLMGPVHDDELTEEDITAVEDVKDDSYTSVQCDHYCAMCPDATCEARSTPYDASDWCDAKCESCDEVYCYERTDLWTGMDCEGHVCDTCEYADRCEYSLPHLADVNPLCMTDAEIEEAKADKADELDDQDPTAVGVAEDEIEVIHGEN
jgi:proteasome lid subunit RPN8/RPN11